EVCVSGVVRYRMRLNHTLDGRPPNQQTYVNQPKCEKSGQDDHWPLIPNGRYSVSHCVHVF
ncbi:MAG: hypothetical protein ACXW3Z_17495, partial [Limisphaerales bacterium]